MLHRASSDAGNRLRRAKSVSSVQYQRRSEPIQAPLRPEHAEAAAIEAFRRAYPSTTPMSQQRLHQRGSRTKRQSEGSHFDQSRDGGRIGTSRTAASAPSTTNKLGRRRESKSAPKPLASEEETRVITRPRHALDTSTAVHKPQHPSIEASKVRTTNRLVRKSKSMFDGHERYQQAQSGLNDNFTHATLDAIQDGLVPPTPVAQPQQTARGGIENSAAAFGSADITSTNAITDQNKARDSHLQDFHKRRLRASSSFINPLRMSFSKSALRASSHTAYDTTVPPFNFSYEGDSTLLMNPGPADVPDLQQYALPKQRQISDSFKNKFKRILGMEKRVQIDFPAQHVTARQYHFAVRDSDVDPDAPACPSPERPPPPPPLDATSRSTNSDSRNNSNTTTSNSRHSQSRITSWTDSTVVGTVPSGEHGKRLSSVDELPSRMRKSSDSTHGLGSVISRGLRFPNRRQSRADLCRTSEESERLYNALRKQIQSAEPPDRTSVEVTVCGASVPKDNMRFGVNSTVPFLVPEQAHHAISRSPTIRTVTPEAVSRSTPARDSDRPSQVLSLIHI